MTDKHQLYNQCIANLREKKVDEFYSKFMIKQSQGETVKILTWGIQNNLLTLDQALKLALVIGIQWREDFGK